MIIVILVCGFMNIKNPESTKSKLDTENIGENKKFHIHSNINKFEKIK